MQNKTANARKIKPRMHANRRELLLQMSPATVLLVYTKGS